MIIDSTNFSYALEILIKDDNIFEKIKFDHPMISADMTSYKLSPNCSCRGKVNKYFHECVDKDPNILLKYIDNKSEFIEKLKKNQEENKEKEKEKEELSGKFFIIKKNEESWKNFAKQCLEKKFKSFYLINKGDNLEVYFL